MSEIHESFEHGGNLKLGHSVVIEKDVVVGDNVTLGNFVVLKKGTRIGDNVVMADYCCTTGPCKIGNGVKIRTRSTVSRCVIVEDDVFIAAGVMTAHTKHIGSGVTYETRIGKGSIIGSMSNILAGSHIPPETTIGAGTNVVKPLPASGFYVGNPARKME